MYLKIILGLSLKRVSDLDVLVMSSVIMSPNYFQKLCLFIVFVVSTKSGRRALIDTIWSEQHSQSFFIPDACGR